MIEWLNIWMRGDCYVCVFMILPCLISTMMILCYMGADNVKGGKSQ